MKAGFVARIRVNPRDCLSVLDIVQSSGINTEGMSFSALTSLAMACMLEALRKAKTIPDNDGFNYEQRMRPFAGGRSTYDRRVLTEAIYVGAAAGLPLPEIPKPPARKEIDPNLVAEYQNLNNTWASHTLEQRNRYKELEQTFSTT